MAKNRIVNTRFWRDDYISNLDPVEKLLFLYFLTNPDTDISGVYELPLKTIATDTGLEKEMVMKIIKRFSKDKKIFYEEGWVGVKNFAKHQLDNPKVQAGIRNGLVKAPKKIIDRLGLSMDSLSHTNTDTNTDTDTNSNTDSTLQPEAAEVNEVFKILYEINPTINFANRTQRKAVERLVARIGSQKTLDAARIAVSFHGKQYAPVITTPLQLEAKFSELVAFYKKQQTNNLIIS